MFVFCTLPSLELSHRVLTVSNVWNVWARSRGLFKIVSCKRSSCNVVLKSLDNNVTWIKKHTGNMERMKWVLCHVSTFYITLFCVANCWFSHDVTKFQTSELLILLRFYFHDVKEQLKTNIHTNFHSKWVLGLVIDYAWISKLLRDMAFTWRGRELLCWFKRWLISGNSAEQFLY